MAHALVLGAGAAGLAAAARLAAGGALPLVLEARERIGGRIATERVPGLATAIELGAEFVHGDAPATFALARRAGVELVPLEGRPVSMADGKPRDDVRSFARLHQLLRRMDASAPVERSFADELARVAGDADPVDRERALEYVRGYHAADPLRASARSILAAELEEGADRGQHRPEGGYGPLLEALAAELPAGALRLGHRVDRVEWRRGAVRALGRRAGGDPFAEEAPLAVIALPAAVLQAAPPAGGVAFSPPLSAKRAALAGLGIGSVLRATFQFDAAWWEDVAPGMGFLRTPGPHAPVWWTAHPAGSPVLVAWAGGTQTRPPLANAKRADRALSDLARHLGVSEPGVRARVVRAWSHDWDADPFARGAYTYPLAGIEAPWRLLAEPLEGTLFFAGEATEPRGHLGTVEGALASGERAAQEILGAASLSR